MDVSVPTEDKIEWEVRRLRSNLSVSPSGMREEHFLQWLWGDEKGGGGCGSGAYDGGGRGWDGDVDKDMDRGGDGDVDG